MKNFLLATAVAASALALTSCGNNSTVTKGSLSEFDTLSYALGSNVGYTIKYQMSDIPFDFKAVKEGIEEAAMKGEDEKHEKIYATIRTYFMEKRGVRKAEIMKKREAADSARLAQGDSTRVEYPTADEAMFESEQERKELSEALGYDIGFSMKKSELPLQLVWIEKAMEDVANGKTQMSEPEVGQYLQYYFMVKRPAEQKAASEKWLAEKEKMSGVKKTESGLLYRIDKEGDANFKPTNDRDQVKVHYTGRNTKGKVFDSSKFENRPKEQQEMLKKRDPENYAKSEPIEFALNRVIKGWTEGMKLVGKGGKITLWIPAELAYGARGAGQDIAPNEALEFEVELIDITPFVEPVETKTEAEVGELKAESKN